MQPSQGPSPTLFFQTINAYQRTAALKAAIDLDLFTAIGGSPATAAELASTLGAAQRGVRILCDFLVILGFLEKSGDRYSLTLDSATFLNRKSPAYAGGAADFLLAPAITGAYANLAPTVRKGGTAHSDLGTVAPEHPVWIEFARSMGPLMTPAARMLADMLPSDPDRPARILDVAAGHGMYGIAAATKKPTAHLTALDWAPVLEVTLENARAAGVADRFSTIAGDAFKVDLGTDYDVILIPNFLHHFSAPECVVFLQKTHAALRSGGCAAIVEFVPNPDRVTPPDSASFSMVMLGTTPAGDAYIFAEYEEMLRQAGFTAARQQSLAPTAATAILAVK